MGTTHPLQANDRAQPHASENGKQCPTCNNVIGTRKDGKIRSHRVGKNRANSWPCPGEEVYT